MKKFYLLFASIFYLVNGQAQNPGLIISEFLQNPGGIDSPFEYVELLATDNIDFSVTPYTIIVSNNGAATANGWIEGGAITYAFEINSGTVTIGNVVYVGGTSMSPTGTILRAINTGIDGGDGGIGSFNTGGVFGNGGGNADGIAVFNLPVSFITSSTVPTDAIVYGTGIGTAELSATDGYELPINDHYSGGKLAASDFFAVDEDLTIASGVFNLSTNLFDVPRTFAAGSATDGTSEITFSGLTPPQFSFLVEDTTINESIGFYTLEVEILLSNTSPSSGNIIVKGISTANSPDDFILLDTIISFPGGSSGTQSFTFTIMDDLIEEQSEYIIVTIDSLVNAELAGITETIIYISDNDRVVPSPSNNLKLELLTSYSNGIEGFSSAEIVVFDTTSVQLFIANSVANNLDILDFSDPSAPSLVSSFNFDSVGFINSIAVNNGLVAVALENTIAQNPGYIMFLDSDGNWLNRLTVGALPDMITFNHAGDQVIVACEGEPSDDYLTDPNGGVSIIDLSTGIISLTSADVNNLDFTSFNAMEASLKASGVRIYGPGSSVAQDFEPEYITVLPGDNIAYVVLQENNALAKVDLIAETILEILPLGTKDHMLFGNGMDVSNQTSGINIANFPVKGMYLPDAISSIQILGTNYLVTANEGDSRDYSGYSEEERVKDVVLDSLAFPDRDYLQSSLVLGRIKMTSANGDIDDDGDFDEIYTLGARSFSIWDEATGSLVFDSGDLIELIIANDPVFVGMFNADNEGGSISSKNRSDDKGPEPEGVYTALIDGNAYLFVSMERVGGVMAFNINDPAQPSYIGYYNNRDISTNGPDRGAEGIIFIQAEDSPNGEGILILANEISSTLSIFSVNSCQTLSDLLINTVTGDLAFCQNDSLEIISSSIGTIDFQWYYNGSEISGETNSNHFAQNQGNYQLSFENAAEGCTGLTDSLFLEEYSAPLPIITVSAAVLSVGSFDAYQWYFEGTLIAGANSENYTPTEDGEYSVIVTTAEGCEGEANISVNFTGLVSLANFFNIYPNPTNDLLNIALQTNEPTYFRIENLSGALVSEDFIQESTVLDVSSWSKGIYFIAITQNGKTTSQRFIVK